MKQWIRKKANTQRIEKCNPTENVAVSHTSVQDNFLVTLGANLLLMPTFDYQLKFFDSFFTIGVFMLKSLTGSDIMCSLFYQWD